MPGETDADRILRERMLQRAEQEKIALDQAKRQRASDLERYANELEAEIPIVLQLLAEHQPPYPGMEEVRFVEKIPILGGLLGQREYSYIRAGWVIDTEEERVGLGRSDSSYVYTRKTYLLSDGYIFYIDRGLSPQELKARDVLLDERYTSSINLTLKALSGVRELHRKLVEGLLS